MNIEMLEERNKMLVSALDNAKKEVLDLTEKLERAKSNFTMLTGHCNEISYLCIQNKNASDVATISDNKPEDDNGKIDEQPAV